MNIMKRFKLFALLTVLLSALPWLAPSLKAADWYSSDNDIEIRFGSNTPTKIDVICTYAGTPPGTGMGLMVNPYDSNYGYTSIKNSGVRYTFAAPVIDIRLYACTEITIYINGDVESVTIKQAKQGNKLKKLTVDKYSGGSLYQLSIYDSNLEEVTASNMGITILSCTSACTALKKINLHRNKGKGITVKAPNIEYLDLNQEAFLPPETLKIIRLGDASNLKSLNVSNNPNLHTIETEAPYSARLTELNADYCNFTSLDKMGFAAGGKNATGLKTLKLVGNEFTELNLSEFTGLERVWVPDNKLTALTGIKNPKLTFISCWGNKINGTAASTLMNDLYNRKYITKGTIVFRAWAYTDPDSPGAPDPNSCTAVDVQKAVAKNWSVREYNDAFLEEEEDADPANTYDYTGLTGAILKAIDYSLGILGYTIKTEAGVELDSWVETELAPGTKVTITALLDDGYTFKEWKVNGVKQTTTSTTLTITMGEAGSITTVSAQAEKIPEYTVKYTTLSGFGTLTAATDKGEPVNNNSIWIKGTKVIFTAKPELTYAVSEWKVNGETQNTTANTLTLTLDKDLDVQVNFALKNYTLNFSVDGGNGTLTAKNGANPINSGVAIPAGTNITFEAAPAAGYEVDTWTVNGVGQPEKSNTISRAISENTDVKVTFVSIANPKVKVTYSAGEGGTLTADVANNSEVDKGTEVTFTATPNEKYQVESWKVNGVTVTTTQAGTETNYTGKDYTLKIDGTTNVVVTFKLIESVEALAADALTVYPNPASDLLNVSGLAVGAEVRLVNLAGAVVAVAQADAQGAAALDVATLPEGEYLLLTPAAGRKVAIRR